MVERVEPDRHQGKLKGCDPTGDILPLAVTLHARMQGHQSYLSSAREVLRNTGYHNTRAEKQSGLQL